MAHPLGFGVAVTTLLVAVTRDEWRTIALWRQLALAVLAFDYCPVAKSVEVLGDCWCLLLVREMLRGVDRFNELERSVPGISRSVLAQRLRHLEREGVVDRRVTGDGRTGSYRLTDAGYELGGVVAALNDWGVRWRVPDGGPSDIDPDGLMLWVRRHVVLDQLPARRVVDGPPSLVRALPRWFRPRS